MLIFPYLKCLDILTKIIVRIVISIFMSITIRAYPKENQENNCSKENQKNYHRFKS